MYLSILKPNPDKPEIPKHKYQITTRPELVAGQINNPPEAEPKFKIPNANVYWFLHKMQRNIN